MSDIENAYLAGSKRLLDEAICTENRTDTSAYKLFGHQIRADVRLGLPMLTTKKVSLPMIIHELLWIISASTNIKYLKDNNCNIWNEWATEDGELGPVYGVQWRKWEDIKIPQSQREYDVLVNQLGYKDIGMFENTESKISTPVVFRTIDQLADAIETISTDPADRRIIVTAYNPAVKPTTKLKPWENAEINLQALPPCHMLFQFNTTPIAYSERLDMFLAQENAKLLDQPEWVEVYANGEGTIEEQATEYNMALLAELAKTENVLFEDVLTVDFDIPAHFLDLQMYQRSADWFLGVPYNITSYSLLLMMVAQQTNTVAREFIHTFGDYHMYENHIDAINTQLQQPVGKLPTITINKADSIDDYTIDDFVLNDYVPGPVIRGKVAV